MKDKKFLALSSFFFLLFFAAISTVILNKPMTQILRAKNASPSPLKSFVIAFPQVGVAGAENGLTPPTKIKVSVFVRDVSGSVLPGRSIKLSAGASNLNISPSDTQLTDNIGQAQFFLTSSVAGKVQLTVTDVGSNTNIVNVPTVEFTE
ncbi:Ig-like domain-containing protein [Candidatus Gottesmanbacteria bacterium]|nr:Ig-like domain-containing protein [Candidatus Gottesmanbacteria bacterium]MBI5452734.1 Ig-like domain-containing protein [Candidatus Gottesmanbacteria bacterium]